MSSLSIFAGATALKRIQSEGINPNMFSAFLGASGGPKWFVLTGLDKVMFNEFLHGSTRHIDIIGSSVGAFRAACFAQNDPAAAIERLADKYSHTVYSPTPSIDEITDKGEAVLHHMMGDNGIAEVVENTSKSVHIVIARCHGLTAKEPKPYQFAGLAQAALRNAMGRDQLARSFTRAIVSNSDKKLDFSEQAPIPTEFGELSKDNLLCSLLASGSIPAIIRGIRDIPGLKPGMFRDGGIIDYHFDMQFNTPDLVLYPHFFTTPTPGWFDKGLKSRACHESSYDNVLMLAPSPEFVDSLPYHKIPDRTDFEKLPAQQRIRYWTKVIKESARLAEDFLTFTQHENPASLIKPINLSRK